MNPKQITSVSLKTSDVDAIVFWTKNPKRLTPFLAELDDKGYRYYFQYTLNDYHEDFEPGMPPLAERLATFKDLALHVGAKRVIWRYDPIIFSNCTPSEFHIEKFEFLSRELSGYTERCIISIVDIYRKTMRGLADLSKYGIQTDFDPLNSQEMPRLLPRLVEFASNAGMGIFSCAEGVALAKYGIQHGKCIDDHLLRELFGINVDSTKDKYQRDLCGCVASRDIGMNDTCMHGCPYCYATNSIEKARKNHSMHNSQSPMLIGEPPADAKIVAPAGVAALNKDQLDLWEDGVKTVETSVAAANTSAQNEASEKRRRVVGPVLVRPFRRLTQAELDSFLEKAADILRGNVDHSEFRGYVFALLFFKRISDVYIEEVRKLTEELSDESLAKDPKMHNFVVPDDCIWEKVAHKSRNQVGSALNDAMIAIERANQPKFDGILTKGIDFNDAEKLPRAKLINLISHFSTQTFDHAHVSDDVFGNAYEYLIRNFASRAGKSSGEFYTPKEVAYLMAEIVDPQPGHAICDWASGSGGLLLQCRNYLKRQGKDPDRLFLHAQESNLSTYNISRINMILHGVKSWEHRQGDSIRNPRHLDDGHKLLKFDRIVMNPPFSLEDWGYDEFQGGDSYGRFEYGMPPRNNGDYTWLEQVAKSLKDDGKAIIVMSQGVLFRGQPEQTEEEDGQNQKADAEYVIREGFVRADIVECVIVLPSKLFYGNSVPACLIVLNRKKNPDRKNKILMVWASRNFEKTNPQNLLRPSDLMRILVPWRAFGDPANAQKLASIHEKKLVDEEEAKRLRRLKDIDDAYTPLLETLPPMKEELEALSQYTAATALKAWSEAPDSEDPYFGDLGDQWRKVQEGKLTKTKFNSAAKKQKDAYSGRVKELKKTVKELEKLVEERSKAEAEVNEHANREIAHIRESAADLLRICSNAEEAARYFTIAEFSEIEENEFNLNLTRYVDTAEPEEIIDIREATATLEQTAEEATRRCNDLLSLLGGLRGR